MNVESAYWQLYGSYVDLYAAEQGLAQALETWRIFNERLKAGRVERGNLALIRGRFEQFRAERMRRWAG